MVGRLHPAVLALVAAALVGLSGRPWGSPVAALLAFVPALYAVRFSRSIPEAALSTFLPAVAMFSIAYEGVLDLSPAWFVMSLLLSSLPFALVGLVTWYLTRTSKAWTWSFLLLWAAVEVVTRALPSPGTNPVAIGLSQVDSPLISLAQWGGVSLLSLTVLAVNGAAFQAVHQRTARPLIAALSLMGVGALLAHSAGSLAAEGPSLKVTIVQGAIDNATLWAGRYDPMVAEGIVRTYGHLSAQAGSESDLLLWPESILAQPMEEDRLPENLTGLASNAALLAGGFSRQRGQLFNSAFLWAVETGPQRYDKRFLAPVFESALTPGGPQRPLRWRDMSVGVSICYDSLVPQHMLESVRSGAGLLAVLSNDSFAGRSGTSAYHTKVSRLRAVELGRFVVHASQGGPSAVYAPTGERLTWIPQGEGAVATARVTVQRHLTPYARLGDWPGLLTVTMVVLGALSIPLRRRLALRKHTLIVDSAVLRSCT